MNSVQLEFLSILDAAIHQKEFHVDQDIAVDVLMEEAKAHDVCGLIYAVLKDQLDLEAYKREVIFQSLIQSRYYQQGLEVISFLQESGIQVVLLKGSVLKSYYPNPDLRTMGDIDLLVPREQLGLVEQLLTHRGYTKTSSHNEKHEVYEGEGFQLEVHWSLVNVSRQKGMDLFETNLWNRLISVKLLEQQFLTLNDEDFLIHLVLHAASHFKSSGFGVRQLCDLTLWIEQKEDWDWTYIEEQLYLLNCHQFFVYCKEACHRYLGLKIRGIITLDEFCFEDFMNHIFSSGVHGKRDSQTQFGNYFAYGKHKEHVGVIWFQCIFPSVNDLPMRYHYAKRYPVLLPIAWIHRIFRVIFHPMYDTNQKVYFFFHSPSIAKQKHRLLKGVGLSE